MYYKIQITSNNLSTGVIIWYYIQYMPNSTLSNSLSQIGETLSKIKSGLSSLSPEEKSKFDNSSSAQQLSSGLSQLSGTISSESARRAVENAKANNNLNVPNSSNDLLKQLQDATGMATKAEAAKKEAEAAKANAEANLSIKEQQQSGLESALAVAKGSTNNDTQTQTTQDTTGQVPQGGLSNSDINTYGLTKDQANDPFVVSQIQRFNGNSAIIGSTIQAMGEMMKTESADTQALMANIDAIAKNQQAQVDAEYKKRVAGATLSGIINGNALYSPEEHQGLISQVILEGKAKLDEISLTAIKTKIGLQQNLRDFKYKTFVEQSDKLMKLNDLKIETVTAIQSELQRVSKEQNDKLLFDQSQEERDATILAEELINASDNQIIETAKANGITPGLLIGAVRQIKPKLVATSSGGVNGGVSNDVNLVAPDGGSVLDNLNAGDKALVEAYVDNAIKNPDKFKISDVRKDLRDIYQLALVEKQKQIELDSIDMPDLTQSFIDDLNSVDAINNKGWWAKHFGESAIKNFQDMSAQAGSASVWTGSETDIKRLLSTQPAQDALRALREEEINAKETLSKQNRIDTFKTMLVDGFTNTKTGKWVPGVLDAVIKEKQAESDRKKKESQKIDIYQTTPQTNIHKEKQQNTKNDNPIWGIK